MANKVWGSVMMTKNSGQCRVIFLGTLKAFQEASGCTRPYISETGNEIEIAAAHRQPGTLLIEAARLSNEYIPYDLEIH